MGTDDRGGILLQGSADRIGFVTIVAGDVRSAMRMCQPSSPVQVTEELDSSPDQSREWINRRATDQATRAANARQLSGRRRFVDPTTCEREYTKAETEFMMAMNEYKRHSGRMFPTWSEVLEVLRSLGYEKISSRSC
jgi:hypothetical protein